MEEREFGEGCEFYNEEGPRTTARRYEDKVREVSPVALPYPLT